MPGGNTATYKRLQHVLCRPCRVIPPTPQNSTQGFTMAFPAIRLVLPLSYGGASCYAVQLAPRWMAYQRTKHLYRYQIPPPRRTLCRAAQPPYYNKVYKGAAARPVMNSCQTVQHIANHASPAGSRCFLRPAACTGTGSAVRAHHPPGGTVQRQGRGTAARNHWRLPPHHFSGFRPIANRGQQ